MYQRILVAVDGSAPSRCALKAAIMLAVQNKGQVLVVHVLDQAADWASDGIAGGASGPVLLAMRDTSRRRLDDAETVARGAGVAAESSLVDGLGTAAWLGEAIAESARNWAADLVVVGTHGRRGPSRLLLGSGAEEIIRLAPVPVLVTRCAAG